MGDYVSKLGHNNGTGCGCLVFLAAIPLLLIASLLGCDGEPATPKDSGGLTMHAVTCQGCGTEWKSSSPEPMKNCYYCESTFCDEGLLMVAGVALMQPNGLPTDPKAVAKIIALEDMFFEHAATCSQCQRELKEQFEKRAREESKK